MSKHNGINRYLSLFAALLFVISAVFTPVSSSALDSSEYNAEAVILYDKTHNRYLTEYNADKLLNTSTSAKVMSGLLFCELLSERLNETVTVTEEMLSAVSGYSMKASVGEKIKIEALLYGAICASYNDCFYILANVSADSTSDFVKLMNDKAKELGASSTSYTNPLGYPDSEGMKTTAQDSLKIALAAQENELFMSLCSARKYTMPATNKSESFVIHNRNYLISSDSVTGYYNENCIGMNAGYSGEAGGWSIITSAIDEGTEYVCVLLCGKESEDGKTIYAYNTVSKLINDTVNDYQTRLLFPAGSQVGEISVGLTGLGSTKAPIFTKEDVSVYSPSGVEIHKHIDLKKDLKAPVSAGDVVGKMTITLEDEIIGEYELVLKESYEVNVVMLVIDMIGQYTKSRAFLATVICFAVLLAIVLIYRRRSRFGLGGRYR